MPYPLQILDIEVSSSLSVPTSGGTIPITVGSSFQPNDTRVVIVGYWVASGGSNVTLGSVSGWTAINNAFATSTLGCVTWGKTLTASDVDTTMTVTGAPSGMSYAAFTVRNRDSSVSFSGMNVVASGSSGTGAFSMPAFTTTAAGDLIDFYWVMNPGSGDFTLNNMPAGMTVLGVDGAVTPSSPGTDGLVLTGQSFNSGVAAGGKTVKWTPSVLCNVTPASIFFKSSSDVTSAITASTETDAGVAVTSALLPSTTNIISPSFEVDTGVEVYNPLQAQSIRPPILLTGQPVTASRVTWQAVTPAAGSTVKVETSLDGGASWQIATSGAAVPGLARGDTTTPVVLTRATLNRLLSTDTSPYFMTLKTEVSVDTSYNELVSLGVFLITQVDITETGGPTGGGSSGGGGGNGVTGSGGSSTGGGLSLVVSGIDLSYAISRNTWTGIYYVTANTNYATAALEIAQNRLPGITSDVSSTEVIAQRLLFGTSQGADPWQDVQDLGTAIGYEAFFDPNGTLRFKAVADPALTPSVWTVSDAANPTMVSYTRSISDSTTYNYVVCSGESTSNTVPVYAVGFDNDPSSPTYYLGPYNIVTTTFISPMITTTAQAQQAADALLLVVKGASETVQITMVPNPALEPGDVITVTRTFNGQKIIQGTFLINSISTPLGQSQAQVLVCYRQSAAQG
jgi:hypothetical protein